MFSNPFANLRQLLLIRRVFVPDRGEAESATLATYIASRATEISTLRCADFVRTWKRDHSKQVQNLIQASAGKRRHL